MSEDRRNQLKRWLESGEIQLQPLTLPQRELWESSPAPPGDVSNHICCYVEVKGPLTPQDSITSVQKCVDRQDVFRTSILPGKEQPVQMIRKSGEPNMMFRDLTGAQRTQEGMLEVAKETFLEPLDLLKGPLYRITILNRGKDDHVLVFAIHHSVGDGWTLGAFIQDLAAAYAQVRLGIPGGLPPLPLTYAAWGAAERAYWTPAVLEQRMGYWEEKLANLPRIWPDDKHPKAYLGQPIRYVKYLDAETARGAKELARRKGATLYSTLLAAFQIALSRWTGAGDDIVVGTPVANRTKQNVRETMGSFAGIVPLRGQVQRDKSFVDALGDVHHTTVESFANAVPFVELTRALGDKPTPTHHPIFEVRFALQNHPMPDVEIRNLSMKLRMCGTGTPRFDLACEITEQGDVLEVAWLYRSRMFGQSDIEDLFQLYERILKNVSASPESRTAAFTA